MYAKLFTKILDSSIWLEPDYTRITWITLLASMNEDGFCAFACEENLASRARLRPSSVRKAIAALSSPDHRSADSSHEGRRIEKVPGGWMVLNAIKYRELATREQIKESTRERVRRFREKQKNPENLDKSRQISENLPKSSENSPVSPSPSVSGNARVTQAETEEEREVNLLSARADEIPLSQLRRKDDAKIPVHRVFIYYREKIGKSAAYTLTPSREKQGLKRFGEAVKMAAALRPDLPLTELPEAAEKLMRYAIDRLAESAWHMGLDRKTKGKAYNGWDNVFRSAEEFSDWVEIDKCQLTTA